MITKIYNEFLKIWDSSTEKALKEFIKLESLSPDFDKNWEENGLLRASLVQAEQWAQRQGIRGLRTEIVGKPGRTPCLFVEVQASEGCETGKTVFMYGHMDKQPPNEGWDADKGPWKPVLEDGKLYGRGGADDGYSFYCQLSALKALQTLGIEHPRCVGLFETCEESGSRHYEDYLEEFKEKLGNVGLVIALDSSCGDYKRLWVTRSLRGMIGGALEVKVLEVGMHSGEASGIVPSSFMIARNLLDRVEDSSTGLIKGEAFHMSITDDIRKDCAKVAEALGDGVVTQYPWEGNTRPLHQSPEDCVLYRNWFPAMTITGVDGMPSVEDGGNVLRPFTRLKVGMRLPPAVDAGKAADAFEEIVTGNPPFNAEVAFVPTVKSNGWMAKSASPWLTQAFEESSRTLWGKDFCYLSIGASIPLMNVFDRAWPDAQFFVAGVLGPKSNAHGPNEFLHVDYVCRLGAAVAYSMVLFGKEA